MPTEKSAPSARAQGKTVDDYVAGLSGWQADVVRALRQVVLEAAHDAAESIKWGQPVYESNGPLAYMKAFKNSVNFGFWRGIDLSDPDGLLEGDGDRMRHVKLAGPEDLKVEVLQAMVRQAAALNAAHGDPTKRKR